MKQTASGAGGEGAADRLCAVEKLHAKMDMIIDRKLGTMREAVRKMSARRS